VIDNYSSYLHTMFYPDLGIHWNRSILSHFFFNLFQIQTVLESIRVGSQEFRFRILSWNVNLTQFCKRM